MAKARHVDGLHASLPFAAAAALTVRVRADELFAHADGVLDTDDIDRVHDMRVATRRLRAVLEIYAACFPPDALKQVLRDVKALADGLGARRDPDVQLQDLASFAAALEPADAAGIDLFAGRLRAAQAEGNVVLAEALERAERHDLRARLDRLVAAAAAESPA
ncbi:MAG: domain containing protein [Solirubrobacterales bacterium]|jgi:CHAD domain-containing protein|nr:domain containing protein [Solirubrobacterales bacterium]